MLFSITGSMTMALGANLIMIFVGRFLMGFGWGIDGPIVGKIALLRQDGKSFRQFLRPSLSENLKNDAS